MNIDRTEYFISSSIVAAIGFACGAVCMPGTKNKIIDRPVDHYVDHYYVCTVVEKVETNLVTKSMVEWPCKPTGTTPLPTLPAACCRINREKQQQKDNQ